MAHPGQRFGAFELVAAVASGGAGEVWRARHVETGNEAALKLLFEADDTSWEREVRALNQLQHPHLVPLYDAGVSDGRGWIASAWMNQGTLRDHPVQDWEELQDLLRTLLDTLAFAHAAGILHRDLKPENILRSDGAWFLADFGIARFMAHMSASRPQGTPFYAAPEQITGTPTEQRPWTDLYSLACVAWEQVTGSPPFTGTLAAVLRQHRIRTPGKLEPRFDVPSGLEPWLRTLLRKEGRHRALFAADAAAALAQLGPPVPRRVSLATVSAATSRTFDLDAIETVEVPEEPVEIQPLPEATLPDHPSLAFRTVAPETGLSLAAEGLPLAPMPRVFKPLWQRLLHAHRTGKAQVVWHDGTLGHRLQTTWVTLWASAHGQPGASLAHGPSVRTYLRYVAAGRASLADGVQDWARCTPPTARRIAAALDEDAPFNAEILADFLARVARVRGLVVEIRGVDRDPERMQLTRALCGVSAPLLCVAFGYDDRTPVPGAEELAPLDVDTDAIADWLTRVAPIDAKLARHLAAEGDLGEAWIALERHAQETECP